MTLKMNAKMFLKKSLMMTFLSFILAGCAAIDHEAPLDFSNLDIPTFSEVTVHDPSVIRVGDTFYVFGSHLAVAKSQDLMHWTQIAFNAHGTHPIFGNAQEKFADTLAWAETDTFWAPDMIQLADGRFYFYYNACRGDSPLSAMGIAVADAIEGPFEDLGIILKSGMWDQISPDGQIYDANIHPNVVDPHVFFDSENRLWMMYGSYSGGIFILELDPETGFPFEGQGYGLRMLGGNHLRIEAPYVIHSPSTGYYYMFLTFGGLDAVGGYNMRIMRSARPYGPYYDASGQAMSEVRGPVGSFFDDITAARYGSVIMRNHHFLHVEGESGSRFTTGYVSPGHNSVYRDSVTGRYFLIFHTRFTQRGEYHRLRVHEMFLNEDGWFVVAPHRYSGQDRLNYGEIDIIGTYKFIRHDREISAEVRDSVLIELNIDGTITGEIEGNWSYQRDSHFIDLVIDDVTYRGVVSHQWNEDAQAFVMTFTAMSLEGISIWGSMVAK